MMRNSSNICTIMVVPKPPIRDEGMGEKHG
jgi:hypothetical protein